MAVSHFNPRSPCGERHQAAAYIHLNIKFQSTLPVWGATLLKIIRILIIRHFNPRSPCGERPDLQADYERRRRISIHAPRVGSDRKPERNLFARKVISIHAPRVGSDAGRIAAAARQGISIHAPRVGSDASAWSKVSSGADFNPRSPCGERRCIWWDWRSKNHFNPRSPCGERPQCEICIRLREVFQSTLPVWGATPTTHR